ncbi:universal stress protein [Streptomyces sp. VRA16 Mangrove soil]|uniref:universal stress protein n=1 Tax=Streptomyces sp. VRA16 Mangrove soil TaxID=2817434 RepID=UPI001A9FDF63|nr:universal stress protein [Streptomyces sp. VRA16 Mangrove soil]MBO1330622.1 universal stress protein [Streptomyces sp. VRA16 Mangrove soil]
MARPITAGVDGSPESAAAAAWAAREAVRRDLPLRLVHVGEAAPEGLALAADEVSLAQWARDLLADAEQEIAERHPGLAVTTDVLDEDGAPEALTAAARDAELLALGSRGHGPLVGFLLGSVGQQVIAAAERPVVLVRSGDEASAEAAGREIVVGQEGDPQDSAAALEFAFTTAAARGAGVRAVRAWSLPPVFAYSPASLELLDESGGMEPHEKKALGEALAPWRERFPDVPVTEHVEIGSAGQVLLSVAAQAQLLVVGRRARRTAVGARIGSVAHAVLHHAPCPVAVVPHA